MGEWISVKDRLPENGQEVLAWFPGDPEHYFGAKARISVFFSRNKLFIGNDYRGNPTHWMPLPDPPKEE